MIFSLNWKWSNMSEFKWISVSLRCIYSFQLFNIVHICQIEASTNGHLHRKIKSDTFVKNVRGCEIFLSFLQLSIQMRKTKEPPFSCLVWDYIIMKLFGQKCISRLSCCHNQSLITFICGSIFIWTNDFRICI